MTLGVHGIKLFSLLLINSKRTCKETMNVCRISSDKYRSLAPSLESS